MAEYDQVKRDLYAGRAPGITQAVGATVRDLANRYIGEREADFLAGRLSKDQFTDIGKALARFSGRIGESRPVDGLAPGDFLAYSRYLSGRLGVHAYNRERAAVASMFNHAAEFGWIVTPIRLRRSFPKRTKDRNAAKLKRLTPGQVRALLDAASPQMRAMILFGILAAFDPIDCCRLTWEHIDLEAGISRYNRPKANTRRLAPLTKETVSALRAIRREGDPLVFRTKYGRAWTTTAIAHQFAVTRKRAKVKMPEGVGFESLRHTFTTLASETLDHHAPKLIEGHALHGMDETYVEAVFLRRLRAVVNHVRRRVFG